MYSFLSFDLWWIFRWFLLLDGRQSNWIHLWSINRNQGDIVMWKIWCHAPWRILDRALWLSHRILRQYPQEILRWGTSSGQELVLQVRHPDYFRAQPTRGPMPVPSDDTNANGIEPLPTLPLPSLHRRRPLRRNLPRPPKNCQWRCRRPPPIRAGEVTELEAGPAAVD
jgi:hypothetical protein